MYAIFYLLKGDYRCLEARLYVWGVGRAWTKTASQPRTTDPGPEALSLGVLGLGFGFRI